MPELPEVETTVDGLNKTVKGLKIIGVWTEYHNVSQVKKDDIKNPKFFLYFRKMVKGQKILKANRRAKNILIHLENGYTILAHMKMTGYFIYNPPRETRYLRLVFNLSNGQQLGFSDLRKFAKITLIKTVELAQSAHLIHLGPEPLDKNFKIERLKECLSKKPNGKIKTVLMDQSIIAGIGNIYSDEILWRAGVQPERKAADITEREIKLIFQAIKKILAEGINLGGDSMSDYRNIFGLPGQFQLHHKAYRKTGEKCPKPGCQGVIKRKMVGGRSAHFCSAHQK